MVVMVVGFLLSFFLNVVCMVSLFLKSSCFCYLNFRNKNYVFFIKKKIRNLIYSDNWLFFGIIDV